MMARVTTLHYEQITYHRLTLLVALLLLLPTFFLTTTGGVRAAESTIQTFYNATFVIDPDANPCSGARTRTTLVVNGVLRRTDLAAGRLTGSTQVAFEGTGAFRIVPDNPRLPTYTAQARLLAGGTSTADHPVTAFDVQVQGRGSDGSRVQFRQRAQITITPNGGVLSFDPLQCP